MTSINPCLSPAEKMQANQILPKGLHMVQVSTNCPKHGVITREVVNIIADTARHTCPKCQADKEQAEKQARTEIRHQQIANQSGIIHYKSFDAWQASNERMVRILSFAQNYIHHPQANLIFSGNTGTGKTMLANLIATTFVKQEKSVLILRSSQICKQAQATWNKHNQTTEQALIEYWTSVDLLVIDEYGEADMANNADMAKTDRERISSIIDGRYTQKKPTIITANLAKEAMIQRLGDRAWDRLQQNAVFITFDWSSYRQIHSNYVEI